MISFIIVNYNSVQEIKRCLLDLEKISGAKNCEVIIVNNDKGVLSIPKYKFEKQYHCEINKNIGYSAANNHGLQHASKEYVCFLNPDTYGFQKNFLDILQFTDSNTFTSPQLLTDQNTTQKWSCGQKITLWETLKNNAGLYKKPWLEKSITPVDWISGASLFACRDTITNLGGFDESYFLYFEDVDLCHRFHAIGGSTLYIPHIKIKHSCGKSSKKARKNQKSWYYKSQDIFFKKHVGIAQLYILRTLRFFHK